LSRDACEQLSLTICTQANTASLLLRAGRRCSGGLPLVKQHIGTTVYR